MGTGTRAAIGTAGVTLAQPDLRSIVTARDLSRATVKTIRQNLVLAFAFNVLAIPIAAGALVPFGILLELGLGRRDDERQLAPGHRQLATAPGPRVKSFVSMSRRRLTPPS